MVIEQLTTSEKLITALELGGAGIAMMRQNIRRRFPSLPASQVDEKVQEWLMRRKGSELGDAPQQLAVRAAT